MRTILLHFIFMFPFLPVSAITFERTYGGIYDDGGYSAVQTHDDGYVAVGYTESYTPGWLDIYLVKTNPYGDTLWIRHYGGIDDEIGYDVVQTPDNGYLILGSTESFGSGYADIYLIKTDSLGDTLWTKTLGGPDPDYGYDLKKTKDGNYIIVGETWSYGSGCNDIYLLKIDSLGNTIWTRTYGDSIFDWARSVAPTSDNGYIAVGTSFYNGVYFIYLIKVDSLGDSLWAKRINLSAPNYGTSVIESRDSCYTITGHYGSVLGTGLFLAKFDQAGDSVWIRVYYPLDIRNYTYDLIQTDDNSYLVVGKTDDWPYDNYNLLLLKTDSLGDSLWSKTYGGMKGEQGISISKTADGGYIIGGATWSYGSGNDDLYLIKTDQEGNVEVKIASENHFNKNYLSQNYPNPFTISTKINYAIPNQGLIKLLIYNSEGRLMKIIDQGMKPRGSYLLRWDGRDDLGKHCPNGVYFYELRSKNQTLGRKKMILVR